MILILSVKTIKLSLAYILVCKASISEMKSRGKMPYSCCTMHRMMLADMWYNRSTVVLLLPEPKITRLHLLPPSCPNWSIDPIKKCDWCEFFFWIRNLFKVMGLRFQCQIKCGTLFTITKMNYERSANLFLSFVHSV